MSASENKALIRRFYDEVWNKGNVAVIDDIVALDYIRHDLRPGNPPAGPGRKHCWRKAGLFDRQPRKSAFLMRAI